MEDLIRARIDALLDKLMDPNDPCHLTPKPKALIRLAPGALMPDDSVCGQLSARLGPITPYIGRTKANGDGIDPCSVLWWTVTVEIKLLRCVAHLTDNGPPSPAQVQADGFQMLNDTTNILKALQTFDWVSGVQGWEPAGPNGDGASGAWTFFMRVDGPRCGE